MKKKRGRERGWVHEAQHIGDVIISHSSIPYIQFLFTTLSFLFSSLPLSLLPPILSSPSLLPRPSSLPPSLLPSFPPSQASSFSSTPEEDLSGVW